MGGKVENNNKVGTTQIWSDYCHTQNKHPKDQATGWVDIVTGWVEGGQPKRIRIQKGQNDSGN